MSNLFSRRTFISGALGAAGAIFSSRFINLVVAAPNTPTAANHEAVVVIFLRGGWDALNVVMPISGADRGYYENARPYLAVPLTGANAAIPLDGQFGFHSAMAPLMGLYQSKKLALIHAAGLTYDTRSHFDAQMFIELGTPGVKTTQDGWLTRILQSPAILPVQSLMPALSAGGTQPLSLEGTLNSVAMNSPSGFRLNGNYAYETLQRAALRDLYNGSDWLASAGTDTLNMVDLIESTNPGAYTPANGAVYPSGSFGDNLQVVAQLLKMPVGLRVATIDVGGWDTHLYEGDSGSGYLAVNQLKPLAEGLTAFYNDLSSSSCSANLIQNTTVVVISEFGRRLQENANHGTDHGHGNVALVMGGKVKGGKVFGQWPGLRSDQLYDGADLAVTTDFRAVLGEIITSRLGIADPATIFPGYSGFTPLNFIEAGYQAPTPPPANEDKKAYLPVIGSSNAVCQ